MAGTYHIYVQPDLNKTLYYPGIIDSTLPLTFEQFWGIHVMLKILFPDDPAHENAYRHLEMYSDRDDYPIMLEDDLDNYNIYVRPYTDYLDEQVRAGKPWRDVIYENPDDPDNSRYTAIFFGRDIPVRGYVLQFDSLEFVQGALSVARWFGLNPRFHITDLFDGNTPMEIIDI